MAKPQAKQKSTPAKSAPTAKKGYWIDLLYFFILLIVVLSVYNKVYDKNFGLAVITEFIILPERLLRRHGYTNINSPLNSPATWFPPGYPFISAIVMKVFGESIEIMNKANGFYLFGSLIFLYLISIQTYKE